MAVSREKLPKSILTFLGRVRDGIPLQGTRDGSNPTFTTPEKFMQNGIKIKVMKNGRRLLLDGDYILEESGGMGTGYDTIIFFKPPRIFDNLEADYIALL